jgi:CRISPR-associated protein Csm1
MLIVGDISGIQDYLFDVVDQQGGQSRRLRARSFFLQTLAEMAALRIRRAAAWERSQQIICAAGKFLLIGDELSPTAQKRVREEAVSLENWLRERTGAQVRFSLACSNQGQTLREQYDHAMHRLQWEKSRAWAHLVARNGKWNTALLVLDNSNNEQQQRDEEIGRQLPQTQWMTVHESPGPGRIDIGGLDVSLHSARPDPNARSVVEIVDLRGTGLSSSRPGTATRRLLRHIPSDENGLPLDFDHIAARSLGAPYLGVLKMDADRLGQAIDTLLQDTADWKSLTEFSTRLDRFFAERLDDELARPQWSSIYTVFAGGDDLLLVGPWNLLFDYAGHVQTLFRTEFRDRGLTISAGLAIVNPKRPIRRAAQEASALLEQAKTQAAPGEKEARDQFAALGQVWKWENHEVVAHSARCLVRWVEDQAAMRGWLHTLLRLTLDREKEPLSAARLAYHIERNYPRTDDRNPGKAALRRWANQIADDFDTGQLKETQYLPAILRYALIATRTTTGEVYEQFQPG